MELTSKQRKHLRGLAHTLEPLVHVGKAGVSDELVAQVDRALDSHELIKVRLPGDRAAKRESIDELVERTGAAEAGSVGHVVILFRPRADPEKRRIRLPEG